VFKHGLARKTHIESEQNKSTSANNHKLQGIEIDHVKQYLYQNNRLVKLGGEPQAIAMQFLNCTFTACFLF